MTIMRHVSRHVLRYFEAQKLTKGIFQKFFQKQNEKPQAKHAKFEGGHLNGEVHPKVACSQPEICKGGGGGGREVLVNSAVCRVLR